MEGKGLWGASWQVAPFQGGAQVIYSVRFCRFSFQSTCFSRAGCYSRGSVHAYVLSTGRNSTVNCLAGSAQLGKYSIDLFFKTHAND